MVYLILLQVALCALGCLMLWINTFALPLWLRAINGIYAGLCFTMTTTIIISFFMN